MLQHKSYYFQIYFYFVFRWFYTPTKARRCTPSGRDFPLPWSIGGAPQWIVGPTLCWWVWRKCYFCSVHSAGVQWYSLLQLDITTVSVHTAYNAICVLLYTYVYICIGIFVTLTIYLLISQYSTFLHAAFSSLSSLLFHQSWLYKKLWSEVEVLLLLRCLCILLSFHRRRKLLSKQEYSSYLLWGLVSTCLQLQHSSVYIFPV